MIASVVTLMPPAVEADPPPTNISASMSSRDSGWCAFVSSIAKPPERVITEPNRECPTRCQKPMPAWVAGLPASKKKRATAPSTSRASVTSTVSLVCRFHSRNRHPFSSSTMTTGKPSAPRNTPMPSTVMTTGSCMISGRPSTCRVNPALLKALTE